MEEIICLLLPKKCSMRHYRFRPRPRVSLVEKLLTSLNLPTQPEIDRLWAEEAERRIAQIDKGEVKLVPGKKVFSNIRKKYRR